MVQQYRPEVRAGDKRIILVDGEVAGAINRVPAADETRSNLHVGGTATADRAHRARPRDLRAARAGAEAARAAVHRHRRDRPLPDRDQRHLAHRHPPGEGLRRRRHRRADLGCDRTESEEIEAGTRDHARAIVCRTSRFDNSRRSIMANIKILGIAGSLRKALVQPPGAEGGAGAGARGRDARGPRAPRPAGLQPGQREVAAGGRRPSMKAKIRAADAILLVTPEYNYSIPGVLKNAIDWCARPYGDSAWKGKPAAIMGASAGVLGTGARAVPPAQGAGVSRHAGGQPARGDDLGRAPPSSTRAATSPTTRPRS